MVKCKYSEQELLCFLKDYHKKYGKVPGSRDFVGNPDYPSCSVYMRAFGNWNNAINKAGLTSNKSSSFSYMSDEELINEIIKFNEEEGHPPSVRELTSNLKYPGYKLYVQRFGSLNNALEKSGLHIVNKTHTESYSYLTNEQLIERLIDFYEEKGIPPTYTELENNPHYPHVSLYVRRFGSFTNALKMIKLDLDSLIEKGLVDGESSTQLKGRLFEKLILESFKNEAIDLSGKNCNSPIDGICPTGKKYDAKSGKFLRDSNRWLFNFLNKKLEEIEYFYLGAFDENYSRLLYVWLVPRSFLNGKTRIYIYPKDINNMKQHEITDKCINIIDAINTEKGSIENIITKNEPSKFVKKVFKIRKSKEE